MSEEITPREGTPIIREGRPPAGNGWRTFGIVMITIILTLVIGGWFVYSRLFPDQFTPVVLSASQQQALERKLDRLGDASPAPATRAPAVAEPYNEDGASREISFTEHELNALLGSNPDLASRLAFNLSRDLISAVMLVDVAPDFPLLGGQTLRVSGGLEVGLVDGRPTAALRGISLWGVPLPDAWLGNLRNVDLMQSYGQAGGFWQAIGEGVESIRVEDGRMIIRLRE